MKAHRAVAPLAFVTIAALASSSAQAGSVTFDWVNMGGTTTASGTLTITSSLLTPADAAGTAQFNINSSNLPSGETFATELSSMSFTMMGHTLTASSLTANSTGWRDNYPGEPVNVLESTYAASQVFGSSTLSLTGNSTPNSYGDYVSATMGTHTANGEWELAPVPLPASAWLLLTGLGALFAFGRRRDSGLMA